MVQDYSPSSRVRVALVSGGLKLGGSTTFLCNLGGELIRRQIPVRVFSFEAEHPLASDFERQHIPVLCQDDRRVIFEDRMSRVLEALRQFQPTTVVATLGPSSFEVLRYLPSGVFRVGAAQSDDPGVYRTLRHYAPHMEAMAAVSKEIEHKLRALPEFAHVPLHYLPYGVPMPQKPIPIGEDPAQPLRVLYLGRLEQEQKRVRLFPRILEQLKRSGIPFHWTVAGVGPEQSFLQANMQTTSPTQTVSFPGKISYAEVPKILAAHQVFLLASDYEGLPLSLLEALGHGLVPVVSDLPSGIREVVDESNGRLVPVAQTDGYAEAIIGLHRNRAELHRLSQNAWKRIQGEFSVRAFTDRWLSVLPSQPAPAVRWDTSWRVRAPLPSSQPYRFWPPVRVLRRWLIKRGR